MSLGYEPSEETVSLICIGWGRENQTPVHGFRDRCPTTGRYPNNWFGMRGSNPHSQIQSLLSYHWTNPEYW